MSAATSSSTTSNQTNQCTTSSTPVVDTPVPINLVADTRAIEKNSVVLGTRDGYYNRLVELTLWFYDKEHRDLLSSKCCTALEMHTVSSASPGLVRTPGSKRKCRNALKKLFSQVKKDDPTSSPIRLKVPENIRRTRQTNSEQRILNYNDISEFWTTKQKKVRCNRSSVERFKIFLKRFEDEDDLSNEVEWQEEEDEAGEIEVAIRLEAGTYEGYRSAIAFLYREAGIPMPPSMNSQLSLYVKGSRRINLAAKQELGLKLVEGKTRMTKEAYEFIAKKFFESSDIKHIFAHVFFVLDWNLMKRAENCVNVKIAHIQFRNDSLVFEFAKSKGSQDGEEHLGPWHVYANPESPHICPVLALARYLCMYPETFTGSRSLFEGADEYNRYHKIFHEMIDKNLRELKSLGVEKGDLGTHSARKGVGTLVATGCTVSPPIVSICLRMRWTMGGVKDRYLKHSNPR